MRTGPTRRPWICWVFLGRRLERTRALLIVIYRDDELGADHPLRGVLGALPPGVVQHVRLGPLSGAAVAELARRARRPAAVLQQVTGGNPLLVSEVLAAGEPSVRTRTRTRRWLASPFPLRPLDASYRATIFDRSTAAGYGLNDGDPAPGQHKRRHP